MKRIFTITAFLLILLAMDLHAQQLPLFTQYRENIGIINPAAVSTDYFLYENAMSFGATYRAQWVGLENGPRTQTLRGDYIYTDGDNVGFISGGHIINDQTGPTGFTGMYGRFSAIISDNPYYGGIVGGLTFGAVQYRIKGSEIRLRELNDVLGGMNQSQWFPDVGLGIYYYKFIQNRGFFDDTHVYGGLSIPQVFGLNLEFENEEGNFETQRVRHYYAVAGFIKQFRNEGYVEPSVWVRYVENGVLNADFNVRYQTGSTIWFGIGASTNKNLHFEAGLLIGQNAGLDNNLKIGYGLDYSYSTFGPTAGAAHEINISYSFGN